VPSLDRVVLDTNILLRGLLNIHSAAGRVVDACDRRAVILLLSRPVLGEYRAVLTDRAIVDRYPELTTETAEVVLRRLRYVGDVLDPVRAKFKLPRDPRDEKFIELAIEGQATHIVTADRDILSVAGGQSEAAARFRQRARSIRVLDAAS
jgi:putative PIN family toxin of toxin-antitoxin system